MDKLSIIRSMHSEEGNHPEGTYYGMTGHRPSPAFRFPSLGSIVSRELGGRNNIPPYVVTPPLSYGHSYMAGNMGPQYNPMIVPDPSKEDFKIPDLTLPKSLSPELLQDRQSFLKVVDHHYRQQEEFARFSKMDTYQEQALRMILSPNVKKAFDLSAEPDRVREAYGKTRFGQSVLLARRLVEAGCRFVTAEGFNHSEWDIHFDNDKLLSENLAPRFDQALSMLLTELEERGLLETTVVMAMGEFGRTPKINARAGSGPLGPLLVHGVGRRRNQGRPGRGRQRRARGLCGRAPGDRRGSLRHGLQGLGGGLDQDLYRSGRSAPLHRQFHRGQAGPSGSRAGVAWPDSGDRGVGTVPVRVRAHRLLGRRACRPFLSCFPIPFSGLAYLMVGAPAGWAHLSGTVQGWAKYFPSE